MKIFVETNKNVIFFQTLVALLDGNSNEYHPLGEKILKEFKYIKKLESFAKFEILCEKRNILEMPWQSLALTVNLNDDLTPKEISPNDGFGPNRLKDYTKNIFPIVSAINTESKFIDIYENKIEKEYEKVAQEIQETVNINNPAEVLMDYWKNTLKPDLIVIPDPFRIHGGNAVSRGNKFYSITGAAKVDNKIIFETEQIISNFFHEFSHLFFDRYFSSNESNWNSHDEICNQLSNKVKGILGEGEDLYGYFAETFVISSQLVLNGRFFDKGENSAKESAFRKRNYEKRRKEGYVYVELFYKALEVSNKPIQTYLNTLKALTL